MPAHRAFISHATEDQKLAGQIVNQLEVRDIPCWIAPRDIKAGDEYPSEIVAGIRKSTCLVLIMSKWSLQSPHVRRELEIAVQNGKNVLTVQLDDTLPPDTVQYYLSINQYIDARHGPLRQIVAKLETAIKSGEARGSPNGNADAKKDRPPRRLSKLHVITGFVILVLLLLGGYVSLPRCHADLARKFDETRSQAIDLYEKNPGKDNLELSRRLLEEADNGGDPLAALWVARSLYNEHGMFPLDRPAAIRKARKVVRCVQSLADSGSVEAQFLYAHALELGIGIERNTTESADRYRRAADADYAIAMFKLGTMCEVGLGEQQNMAEAIRWYQKAEERGDVRAMTRLGDVYREGRGGVSVDSVRAVQQYKKAADHQYADAQFKLGEMLITGTGVSLDVQAALELWAMAAQNGSTRAKAALQTREGEPEK